MSTEFPGNSRAKRPEARPAEPKVVKKVVKGKVIVRKKSLYKRFAETFTGDDTRGVGGYVWFEVMVPAFKDLIADAAIQGVERKIFGDSRPGSSRRGGYRPSGASGYTSYASRYAGGGGRTSPREDPRPPLSRQARSTHNFNEIVLDSRGEATLVLDQMIEILEEYEVVTVRDFLVSVDETPEYMDEKYGWFDLTGTDIRRVRGGYIIQLPRPQSID